MSWLQPLHDAESMRASDSWAIEELAIPSLRLMESAGRALADAAGEVGGAGGPIRVVCGKGNNGGDGLVAARLLAAAGFEVEAVLLWPASELAPDAAANLERLPFAASEIEADGEIAAALAGSAVVIDAIFGTGFSDEPRSPAAEAITAINGCGARVVAADVASGVDASTGETAKRTVRADLTVAFHAPKIGHRIAPGKRATGELRVAEIGIPAGAPVAAPAGEITAGVLALAPPRGAESTKFSSGRVTVAGGSRGLTGSVCLAAEAAIRAGAGYATVAVPGELEPIFEAKLTEVMSSAMPAADGAFAAGAAQAIAQAAEGAGCAVLGPGIGRSEAALAVARDAAAAITAPLLLDADGLNAHAGSLASLAERAAPTVLTPHAGELGRLLDLSSEDVAARRLHCARRGAALARAVVVLKGSDTIVVDGRSDRIGVNVLESPALATAGTGDVLAGMIGALIARGVEPFAAACAGVLAHARAGQIAAARAGAAEAVIASDVIAALAAGLAP